MWYWNEETEFRTTTLTACMNRWMRKMEILRKNEKEMLKIKNSVTKMRMPLMGLLVYTTIRHGCRNNFWAWSCVNKILKTKKQRQQRLKNPKQNFQGLCDNYKRFIKCIMGTLGEERGKRTWQIFQIIKTGNFFKLMVDSTSQNQEAQTTPRRINVRKVAAQHFRKWKILKENRKIHYHYRVKGKNYIQLLLINQTSRE